MSKEKQKVPWMYTHTMDYLYWVKKLRKEHLGKNIMPRITTAPSRFNPELTQFIKAEVIDKDGNILSTSEVSAKGAFMSAIYKVYGVRVRK